MVFTLLALQLAVAPNTCADFSGRYVIQGEDGRVAVHIEQTRCERISISWESSLYPKTGPVVHSLVLGSRSQPDAEWFGAPGTQRTAATLRGRVLELLRLPATGAGDAGGDLMLRLELLADGDFCTSNALTRSRSPAMRASRQRGTGKEAEDVAAARSARGCSGR
jgi:hypothetical protein